MEEFSQSTSVGGENNEQLKSRINENESSWC